MSMRKLMAKAAGGLVIAFAAGHMTTLQAQGAAGDQQFVNQVAAGNLLEVRLAQTAQKKAESPTVKQFAQRMVIDHTSMQKQWMAAAKRNNLDFKAELSPELMAQLERLNSMSGAELDRAYMSLMAQNHRDRLASFQNERRAAHSAEVMQLIDVNLPILQEHSTLAQQIAPQVGGDVAATPATPTDTTRTVATQPGQVSIRADSAFLSDVAASNAAELRLANVAGSRASDPQVKSFAQKMTTDYKWMQQEWAGVTSRNGLRFNAVSPRHQEQLTRLQGLSGTEFDRAYMSAMVQNHQENVNAFQTRGRTTQSPEVRQLVSRSLPYLEEHLTLAQQVSSRVGVSSTTAVAAGTDQGKRGNVSADRKFIRNIDADHFLEIRLGRLAERKATDASVRQFGRKMVDDHSSMHAQWTAMARNNGMDYKSGMGPRHRSKLQRLEKLSGREFDRAYMSLEAQNHQDYLDYFRKEGRGANSAPVRELVNRGIPVLEQQIRQAKQIGVRVGADTVTTSYGRISVNQN